MSEKQLKEQGQEKRQKQRPVTVKIENFKESLNRAVAGSELPPFLLEMLLGEYLAGISQAARQEYIQDRAEWERERETDG